MGGHPSGNRGGMREQNRETAGSMTEIRNVTSLKEIQDPEVYRETSNAISRFHSVLGVRERDIKLADIITNNPSFHTRGVQFTDPITGTNTGIYLQRGDFMRSRAEIESSMKSAYAKGWSTETNKPIAHTVTHELGHALWNGAHKTENAQAAGKEIKALYKAWMRDPGAPGYGKYATTNVDEFWAETVTKAVHGKQDKYTAEVKRIVRDYKL